MNNSILIAANIKGAQFIQKPKTVDIKGLSYDSRNIQDCFAYFAFEGIHVDGNDYINEAIEKGATLIITSKIPNKMEKNIGYLLVKNPRKCFAQFSSLFYDKAHEKLKIIGITGTDGKTTTSNYLYYFLKKKNKKVGLLTTVYLDDGSGRILSPYRQSTPEADVLHKFFNTCLKNEVEYVILECTSHSLSEEMSRVYGLSYFLSIITTITREHLEFHKTLDNYIDAKCNIIRNLQKDGTFITTKKNPHYEYCCELAKTHPIFVLDKDLKYSLIHNTTGIDIQVDNKKIKTNVKLDILISNALLAAKAASVITKDPLESFYNFFIDLPEVKGRMNEIHNNLGLRIVVDFAHTADAFYNLMSSIKTENRIICVFGCAGERDTGKRYEMGKIAATYCDIIILTEEDPRKENPQNIFNDILKGINQIKKKNNLYIIENRKDAIKSALDIANKNEIILLLGKGHEQSIETSSGKIPWNEIEIVKTLIKEKETNGKDKL